MISLSHSSYGLVALTPSSNKKPEQENIMKTFEVEYLAVLNEFGMADEDVVEANMIEDRELAAFDNTLLGSTLWGE